MENEILQKQKRLNVGCGRNIIEGWLNLDMTRLPGVDIVADLDACSETALPLEDNTIDEFLLSHVIEHINSPLPLMQELWRIAKRSAKLVMRVNRMVRVMTHGKIQLMCVVTLRAVSVIFPSRFIGELIMVIEGTAL